MNVFTRTAAIAAWATWVAICGGGSVWAFHEFQQCRSVDTCLFTR